MCVYVCKIYSPFPSQVPADAGDDDMPEHMDGIDENTDGIDESELLVCKLCVHVQMSGILFCACEQIQ
jgi:hypothetical protein